MPAKLRADDALKLFSGHMSHARHLDSYLLSFTQVFLLMTGALWGYALVRAPSPPSSALTPPLGLPLEGLIFAFHIFYCFAGGLFVVRLSVNFRKSFEAGRTALEDAGLGDYAIRVYPESSKGKIEIGGIGGLFRLLLTAKASFLLIYAGAAGVDAYYLTPLLPSAKLHSLPWRSLLAFVVVVVLFLMTAGYAYWMCNSNVPVLPAVEAPKNGGAASGLQRFDSEQPH